MLPVAEKSLKPTIPHPPTSTQASVSFYFNKIFMISECYIEEHYISFLIGQMFHKLKETPGQMFADVNEALHYSDIFSFFCHMAIVSTDYRPLNGYIKSRQLHLIHPFIKSHEYSILCVFVCVCLSVCLRESTDDTARMQLLFIELN